MQIDAEYCIFHRLLGSVLIVKVSSEINADGKIVSKALWILKLVNIVLQLGVTLYILGHGMTLTHVI